MVSRHVFQYVGKTHLVIDCRSHFPRPKIVLLRHQYTATAPVIDERSDVRGVFDFCALSTEMAPFYDSTYDTALLVAYITALLAFIGSLVVIAPYGRFGTKSGLELNPKLGWWLMEIMATVSFLVSYPQGPNALKPVPMIFAVLFLIHYANRGWYFPFSLRVDPGAKASFSIVVVVSGLFVTSLHGYLNAMWYSKYCSYLDWDWLLSPTCLFGLALYEISFWSTIWSESIIRSLRDKTPSGPRYQIPRGFLFEYITSPQYLTELLGFAGWAIMTWSPAGLFIFLISAANLVPRAVETHKWYQEKFKEEYPKQRRILIPFLW
jgi:3-oxo-5-alpha-steroid 4-dehydrogenase 1